MHDLAPLDHGADAVPGESLEARRRRRLDAALGGGGEQRGGERMLGAALGRRREPQHLVLAGIVRAAEQHRCRSPRGLPSVIVPVLSSTTVSSLCAVSSEAPSRIRIPFSAPLPVPTMIAVGRRRPRAQGHAITSTATKLSRA